MGSGDSGARRRRRLSRSGEFDRVYREGSSRGNRELVAYRFPREDAEGETRLGISVGRKIGGAVDRNRVKRVLREAFWELADEVGPGQDVVIVARPPVAELIEREGGAGARTALAEVLELGEERST